MDIYLVVTIDVEPDASRNWLYSYPLSFNGVYVGVRERLQPLFNRFGISVNYMINNVVLEDPRSVEVLSGLKGKFELGTHLHPEFIEPQKLHSNYAGKKGVANQCYLKPDIDFEKLKNITKLFTTEFGYPPYAFRAGRFSAGPNTISSLSRLGYKVDTSVTPHLNWNDSTREKPVDFTTAPEQPYFVKKDTLLDTSSEGVILEVPVSIVSGSGFYSKRPLWLRPVTSSSRELMKVVRALKRTYAKSERVVLNMMFHNVEVVPGLSPYTKTEKDCAKYLSDLEDFFSFSAEQKVASRTLSELYMVYDGARSNA